MPQELDDQWIGQEEILKQVLACWLVVDDKDLPLTPRLVGPPGIGKTALKPRLDWRHGGSLRGYVGPVANVCHQRMLQKTTP